MNAGLKLSIRAHDHTPTTPVRSYKCLVSATLMQRVNTRVTLGTLMLDTRKQFTVQVRFHSVDRKYASPLPLLAQWKQERTKTNLVFTTECDSQSYDDMHIVGLFAISPEHSLAIFGRA